MRRNKYSKNIADWLGGTRGLSDRAYRLYDELCLLIAEAGGRLRFSTKHDIYDVRRKLACDSRKLFAALAELKVGERPKLMLVDGWLVNRRVLRELRVLLVAIEDWGWPEARLVGELGVDPKHIDAERHARDGARRHGDKPVEHGDNGAAGGSRTTGRAPRSATSPGEVSGKSGGSPGENEAGFITYQSVTAERRFPLLSSLLPEEVDRSSPVPRARDRGSAARPLGEDGAGRPPRATGFRWGRPETAEAKLLLALMAANMAAADALSLIERASNPSDPGFGEASRACIRVSWAHRCGWYPPPRVVH